jgi:hypothetical protein
MWFAVSEQARVTEDFATLLATKAQPAGVLVEFALEFLFAFLRGSHVCRHLSEGPCEAGDAAGQGYTAVLVHCAANFFGDAMQALEAFCIGYNSTPTANAHRYRFLTWGGILW